MRTTKEEFLTYWFFLMTGDDPDEIVPGEKYFFSNATMNYILKNDPDYLDQTFNSLYAFDTVYSLDTRTNIYNLTHQPLINLREQIDIATEEILDKETAINELRVAVSIMTVATLMATAISTRLEERRVAHDFSKVRAEMRNDPSLVMPEVDKFSLILLGLALVIAIAGLIMALWV